MDVVNGVRNPLLMNHLPVITLVFPPESNDFY
jgi:hypothetical protein